LSLPAPDDEEHLVALVHLDEVAGDAVGREALHLLEGGDGLLGEEPVAGVGFAQPSSRRRGPR
jgi:hypothetical protein